MKSLLLFSGVILSLISQSCSLSTHSSRPLLFQNYRIQATKNETRVEATVFFRERLHNADADIVPMRVAVNDAPMARTQLASYVAPTFRTLLKKDGPQLEPNNINIRDSVDGYELTIPTFSTVNEFVVTRDANDQRKTTLAFSPVEVTTDSEIRLSRTRSNEISFVGGDGDKDVIVGFSGSGDKFDDEKVRIDWNNRKIVIPAGSLSKMPIGEATLFLISSAHSSWQEPYSEGGPDLMVSYLSSYIFTYTDEVRVLIVD